MTGGPISDDDGVVTFWARSKDQAGGNRPEPFSLKGTEFVRRWTMHLLPQGFTRARSYGGYLVMECISKQSRPSWKKVFERGIYADPTIYWPMHHIYAHTHHTHPVEEYG